MIRKRSSGSDTEGNLKMSLIGKYPCVNVTEPALAVSVTSAAVNVVLCVPTIVGNTLVLLALALDPYKNLRSPFSLLVANLAAADLLIGVFVEPTSLEFFIREAKGNPEITTMDTARRIVFFIASTASLLSVSALSVERYLAITYPLKYRYKLNPLRTSFVSLVIWVFAISFSLIYLKVGYLRYHFVFTNTAVVATFLVYMLTYFKVFKRFKKEVKSWDRLHEGTEENRVKKQATKLEKKITKTLLIMMALFIACFLPSLILVYIISFCTHCDCSFIHWIRDINYNLILVNSCMNSFVIAWRLEPYRKAFARILGCGVFARGLRSASNSVLSVVGHLNMAFSGNPASETVHSPELCNNGQKYQVNESCAQDISLDEIVRK
ncbi:melanocortin receptor 5 [Nematostella vectensis]|uniref:melanocortin receptor 5 n=1 Tax=Nematostella vectensis TaxID=45351 RepID=UPI0020773CF2|nr:melanocortin receptor 5 [Nematostella vectensis]